MTFSGVVMHFTPEPWLCLGLYLCHNNFQKRF